MNEPVDAQHDASPVRTAPDLAAALSKTWYLSSNFVSDYFDDRFIKQTSQLPPSLSI